MFSQQYSKLSHFLSIHASFSSRSPVNYSYKKPASYQVLYNPSKLLSLRPFLSSQKACSLPGLGAWCHARFFQSVYWHQQPTGVSTYWQFIRRQTLSTNSVFSRHLRNFFCDFYVTVNISENLISHLNRFFF